jgi:hypothetical protein
MVMLTLAEPTVPHLPCRGTPLPGEPGRFKKRVGELFPFFIVRCGFCVGVVGAGPYASCAAAPDALDMGVVGACPCEK